MAAAEPDDAGEPAAPPELCRGLSVRPSRGRPAAQAARAAGHRQAERPPRGVPGADPRPAAAVHHLGPVRGESGPTRVQPGPAGPAGGTPPGGLAAGRPAAMWAL